jgi:hypothetical protein
MSSFLSLFHFFLLFLSCFKNVELARALLQLRGTASAHAVADTATATFDDHQHHSHSDKSAALKNDVKPYQHQLAPKLIQSHHFRNQNQLIQTKNNCPNSLQDGNYIFRSSSEEDWSFCGVSGTGFHEFYFQIRNCECFAGISGGRVCASASPSSVVEPIFKSSSVQPATIAHPDNLPCSADDCSISSHTCLLITLSDQFGDGWTSGDGSTENAWFGYSVTSSNDVVPTSAITYHSLSCSCPRKIVCISPSSSPLPSGDQLINLAIYSKKPEDGEEATPVAFSWEIMYLVQVIQNGRLINSYHGGYRTQMEFRYNHSSDTLTLSSKTDGPVGNGDAVDVSGCKDPAVVGLMSELPLSLKGWSIVDINNKHEPYSGRNPLCFHTHLHPPSPHSPHAQDVFFDVPASSSRHLSGELQSIGIILTLAGVAGSSGAINGIGTNSQFNCPIGVAISPDGLFALVGDRLNHLIRRIILSTASVSTLAGVAGSSGAINGIGTNSKFNYPVGVAISPDGLFALVAESNNHLIRQIILSTASVSTLAGVAGAAGAINGIGTNSKLNAPDGVSISPDGLFALIGDNSNHLIRHIILSTASVSTLAGVAGSSGAINGIGTNSKFSNVRGVSISPDGLFALVGDFGNHLIRQIVLSTASVSTLAGVAGSSGAINGIGTNSKFKNPHGVPISRDGLFALVGEESNHLIRQIILSTASVSTLAGVAGAAGAINGIGTNSKLNAPDGVSISPDGFFALVGDALNHLIRQIILPTAPLSSLPSAFPSLPSVSPSSLPSASPYSLPSVSPSSLPSASPSSLPSVSPSSLPSASPSSLPSASPSSLPSASPTIPSGTLFGFGAKFGDVRMLGSGKAILVDYLQDKTRGLPDLLLLFLFLHPSSVSGKMLPISRIVNSSRVSSASEPPLSCDSILIKWRLVSAVSGIGSWKPISHTILSIPAGGVLVSWLVSLLSEEIKGFIVKGERDSLLCSLTMFFFPSSLLVLQIPCPLPITSTSSNILTPPPPLCLSPSLPTRPSRLEPLESIFPECPTSVSISSTRDYLSSFLR